MGTSSPLNALLNSTYAIIKRDHPSESRRRWKLRTAAAFWDLSKDEREATVKASSETNTSQDDEDDDLWDAFSVDAPGLGLLVRTDFSNEDAWQAFSIRLQDAENEIVADALPSRDDAAMDIEDDAGEESSDDEDGCPPVFAVVNPASDEQRRALSGLSNLGALRLLCEVDIRQAPPRPTDVKAITTPNRLIDRGGYQEIYDGKGIWIYDAKSNIDQSVRVVNLQGDVYGTATADSWRARVGHICELQLNMAMGAMRIDFGGLDRWDYLERQRNLLEAEVPLK